MIDAAKTAGFITLLFTLAMLSFLAPIILVMEGYALGVLLFPVGVFLTVFVGEYGSNTVS